MADTFPLATIFTGVSIPPPSDTGISTLKWLIPTLAPNATARVRFEVVVSKSILGVYTLIYNSATVQSDQTGLQTSNTTLHIYDPALFPR